MKVATALSGKQRSAALCSKPLYRRTIDSRSIAIYAELSHQLFFYMLNRLQIIDMFATYRLKDKILRNLFHYIDLKKILILRKRYKIKKKINKKCA